VHWNLSPTTRTKLTIASNRPSVRSVFPSDRKEEKKTRSSFSTHSNPTATPSKGKEKGRDSEITIKGSDREKEGSWGRKRGKRTPLLIKHLGGVERRKGESHNPESSPAITVAADLLHPFFTPFNSSYIQPSIIQLLPHIPSTHPPTFSDTRRPYIYFPSRHPATYADLQSLVR
jgi:hypothetical protein